MRMQARTRFLGVLRLRRMPVRYRANFALVREVRTAAGLTQEELAHRCGFEDQRIINDIESKTQFTRGRKFEFESLQIVATELGLPVSVVIHVPIDEIDDQEEPENWLSALAKAWGIPTDAINHWTAAGAAEGKIGRLSAAPSAGRLLVNGMLYAKERQQGKPVAAGGYLGCTLFTSLETIDLPAVEVSGPFAEFFDIKEIRQGAFSTALWSRRVVGHGSYDRANGYHLEGRIATARGRWGVKQAE